MKRNSTPQPQPQPQPMGAIEKMPDVLQYSSLVEKRKKPKWRETRTFLQHIICDKNMSVGNFSEELCLLTTMSLCWIVETLNRMERNVNIVKSSEL